MNMADIPSNFRSDSKRGKPTHSRYVRGTIKIINNINATLPNCCILKGQTAKSLEMGLWAEGMKKQREC